MSHPTSTAEGVIRPLLRLTVPVLVEQFLHMLVGFSDAWLAGKFLERPHLAAMAFLPYALWLLSELFVFVGIGTTAMVARFVGAGNSHMARRVVHQSLLLGGVLAAAFTILGWGGVPSVVSLMQLSGPSADLAGSYLRIVILALPALMVERVGVASLRGAGDMVSGLAAMAAVNVVNVAVSWTLLLGLCGLPRLGWDGLAVGTAVGHCVGALLVLCRLHWGRAGLRFSSGLLRPDRDLAARILRVGVPGGIDVHSIIACQLWFLSIINGLGELASSAHGLALRIESLAYLPGEAFQVAAATLAGQYLGARDPLRAGRSILAACLLGGGMLVTTGVVIYAASDSLVWLFLKSSREDVAAQAAPLLRIVAFAMPSLAVTMILTGALRGAGDTRWPLVFSIIGMLGVRIPVAYWLTSIPALGVQGAWYAMIADLSVRAVLVLVRFFGGGWRDVEV
jgi:putative MATE family efflux protein